MDPLRDRIFGLLSDLCGEQHDVSPDGLRLLSHTILGVARDNAPSALFAVRDALPYVIALIEASDGADADTIADMLIGREVVRAITRESVARRIEDARAPRTPPGATTSPSSQARLANTIRDLALLDMRLMELSMRSTRAIRDELLEDPELLSSAIEMALAAETTDAGRRFAYALERRAHPTASAALATLSDLETRWDGGALHHFSERTRRFELAAADHLRQAGLLPAVRAALTFAEPPATFANFSLFANDPGLDHLAVALASVRGTVLAHVRGEVPLQNLDGWISYLRGACSELAEQRDISVREATSFAHFCLHLMNFCDLAPHELASDAVRLTMMKVEDELKAFALHADRPALPERNSLAWRHNAEFEALAVLARSEETPLELRILAQRRMEGILGEELPGGQRDSRIEMAEEASGLGA